MNAPIFKIEVSDSELRSLAIQSGNPILLLDRIVVEDVQSTLPEEVLRSVIDALLANNRDYGEIISLRNKMREMLISKNRSMLEIDDAIFQHLRRLLS